MSALSKTPAWLEFSRAVHEAILKPDALRVIHAADIDIDLSTQLHCADLTRAGEALLQQQDFDGLRNGLFEGAHINWTEDRAAWHTALRAPEPPAAVLAGLAAYVRALDPAACPARAREPLSVALLMADARRAMKAARAATQDGDPATAVLMVAGARSRLGLIDERFHAPALSGPRARLHVADRDLVAIQTAIRGRKPAARGLIDTWLAHSAGLEADLARQAPLSLFDPARLSAALSASRRLPG